MGLKPFTVIFAPLAIKEMRVVPTEYICEDNKFESHNSSMPLSTLILGKHFTVMEAVKVIKYFYLFCFLLYFKYNMSLKLHNIEYTKQDIIMYIFQLEILILLISEAFFILDIVGYQVANQKNC